MCNGIFDICLTTLPRNLPVQFFNRLKKIRQNYGQESVAHFWLTLSVVLGPTFHVVLFCIAFAFF